jgi:hypothetical protein
MDELEQMRTRAVTAEHLAKDLQARLDAISELAREAREAIESSGT